MNLRNNLKGLNSTLGDWYDRSDAIHEKYLKKTMGICPYEVDMAIRLKDDIEEHRVLLLYRNLLEPYFGVYFVDKYTFDINYNVDAVKALTGDDLMNTSFVSDLLSKLHQKRYNVLYETFTDALYLYEHCMRDMVIETWVNMQKQIESNTLEINF